MTHIAQCEIIDENDDIKKKEIEQNTINGLSNFFLHQNDFASKIDNSANKLQVGYFVVSISWNVQV